ncbi:Bipolar kinesin KRP-130 [Lucilia cuprina]|uniref:Bipolar kinesin KRP-130 n=1 Tax=Lucilia cuprina TaxID=7375 RepID=A0A0L0CR22_LUCCU|nr:Kinesin-like protein Klp61F [Lucilia cuprina]KNC34696.1 Bipolar kinesin KRP-130 [Lucilia cuprina]
MRMDTSGQNASHTQPPSRKTNQNIQVYVRVRPLNARERCLRSAEIIEVISPKEIVTRHTLESKLTKKFTFDRAFGSDSKQVDVYTAVVSPLIDEVLSGYNCTVFAYGQTGTGKTHTMVGNQCAELKSSWEDDSDIGIIPRALCHLFDELRMMKVEFSMRISYLELYNEELCDLLSSDESTAKIRIYDDSTKKGSVIIQGLEEIPVHSKDDVYKLLEKGKERRKTAATLMNAQSSRSHTVFSILVHIKENGIDGEEMLKIGKLNLVDLAGSENASKAGNEKGIRTRETVNINQSLLTLGRVITALVERTPHIPYRESKLTRLLQESLGGRTKTSIIATISPGHKDIEETLSTLEYAHRAKNIQNKPEVNQKLTKKIILKEYTEEIDKLKRDLMAARDKNGIYLAEETYTEMTLKMDSQNRELNEKMLLLKALKDELSSKEKIFNEVSLNLVEKTEELNKIEKNLMKTTGALMETKKVLTTTKRRYKEKKVLLESHVKTEETLKNQATKIMEVADIATKDTEALHKTIERRKDVDVKIQSACERFAERMNDNFELLDDNLKQLQNQQHTCSHDILQELDKITFVQSDLLDHTKKKLHDIDNLCDHFLTKSSSLEEFFTNSFQQLNDEQKSNVLRILEEIKEKEHKFQQQIKENLSSLEVYNEQQKSSLDSMRERIIEKFTLNKTELEKHTDKVNATIEDIKQKSLENLRELQKINSNLNEERCLMEEEQKLMEEFQKSMKALQEKRTKCNDNIGDNVKNLENCQQHIINTSQGTSVLNQKYLNNRTADCKENCSLVDSLTAQAELCIDQSVAKCSTINVQLDNMLQETVKQTQLISQGQTKYHQDLIQSTQHYENESKRLRLENCTKLKINTEKITLTLDDHAKCVKDHLNTLKNTNATQQTSLRDYTQLYKKQMTHCVNDLESFRRSELKTYTATGATPSKKEFSYPRVLAETSPHTRIVKRFRQENEWSDLDTTVPIDEESEGDIEDGIISIHDISDAETILNSTPKCSSNKKRTSNQLKVQQNGLSKPNSRSNSRSNSPYLKENKENIA